MTPSDLWKSAEAVLRAGDRGTFTQPGSGLYPHQWSWDSAIVAAGWAHLDLHRAITELDGLFATQWANGKMPHIVFHPGPDAPGYFPGPDVWDSARSPEAPQPPAQTSGLAAPPVHALALRRVWEIASSSSPAAQRRARDFVAARLPQLLDWHRYLAGRDPDGSGLVTIFHPWESWDNSPQWDAALHALHLPALAPYQRRDLAHVTDAAQRPTSAHYDRFLWLLELLRATGYDDASIQRSHPFLIRDVSVSSLLLASNEALFELADVVDAGDAERSLVRGWIEAGRRGMASSFDETLGLCLSHDVLTAQTIPVRTISGLAPLFAESLPPAVRRALLACLDSPAFAGHARLRWPLPPSASPEDPAFEPRNYWRGPVWPVITWLLWLGLRRSGAHVRAEGLRRDSLEQVAAGGFSEYFEPFTGEPLGARQQAWTAAAVLDWLADERAGGGRGGGPTRRRSR